MRHNYWLTLLAGLTCAAVWIPAEARTVRDSAGLRIVENARPAWTAAQVLRLAESPTLVIGTQPGGAYELFRVAGAVRLSDGRIVIADGASLQLRLYDSTATFIKAVGGRGDGPGEFRQLTMLSRLPDDTLVASGGTGNASFFTDTGAFVRRVNVYAPPVPLTPGIRLIIATFGGGSTIVGAITNPAPRARGTRWVDSFPLIIVDRENAMIRQLGSFPSMLFEMGERNPSPPWFGPIAVYANNDRSFFFGFGAEYTIRVYSAAGRLERLVRRRWTPVRVTSAHIDSYVTEWSKRWIKSTGAEAEQQKKDLRNDPYAATVPAFSQFIADRAGRLWVREAHLADAPGAGQLNTLPLVPSVWSVFGAEGRWLGDVTMPARFLPKDIGADYVLGVARDADGVETVGLYRLRTTAASR